jgi:transcription antitermination factor NusG
MNLFMAGTEYENEQVFTTTSLASPADRKWIVLWTKARQEKAVARYLQAVGADFYLPLKKRVGFTRGRKTTSMVPLFPGYVFLAGRLEDGYAAISTKRVCQILQVPDQKRFSHEIAQIRQALDTGGTLELYSFAEVGRRCRVRRGPLLGVEGVITSRMGQTRLVLHVSILGQAASLEIDADFLEPLD